VTHKGLVLAFIGPVFFSSVPAQEVHLKLTEQGSRAPVAGALVRLIGVQGVVMQSLSSASGRATLRSSVAGNYWIRIDQIGATGTISPPFDLAAGEIREKEFVIQSSRVTLPTIEVRAQSRCGGQTGQGTLAAILWEEIAKALSASVLAEQGETLPLIARRFRRELRRDGTPSREWVESASQHQGRFYSTLAPAVLAESGYVSVDQLDSVRYSAPDADLLLSDEFVTTHCFRAKGAGGGLVGLEFEPAPGRRLPDVRGTLWVNRETSELRFLEYSYTGLPGELQNLGLGGRVEYLRLPTGSWIVSYWHVRTPRLEILPVRGGAGVPTRIAGRPNRQPSRTLVAGFTEVGGRITPRMDRAGPIDIAMILGQVFDSTTGKGLSGVVLHIPGSADSGISNDAGEFRFATREHGDRELLAGHPKLRLPDVRRSQNVLLSLGDTLRVEFTVPSARTLAGPSCGRRKDQAGIVGIAMNSEGTTFADMKVRAQWRTASGELKQSDDRTSKEGLYALCGLPADELITVLVFENERPILTQTMELAWGAFLWFDLRIPEPPHSDIREKGRGEP